MNNTLPLKKTYALEGRGLKAFPASKYAWILATFLWLMFFVLIMANDFDVLGTVKKHVWVLWALYFTLMACLYHFPDILQKVRSRLGMKSNKLPYVGQRQLYIGEKYLTLIDLANQITLMQIALNRVKKVYRKQAEETFWATSPEHICILCHDGDTYILEIEALTDEEIESLNHALSS